jgi:hypothetical protein
MKKIVQLNFKGNEGLLKEPVYKDSLVGLVSSLRILDGVRFDPKFLERKQKRKGFVEFQKKREEIKKRVRSGGDDEDVADEETGAGDKEGKVALERPWKRLKEEAKQDRPPRENVKVFGEKRKWRDEDGGGKEDKVDGESLTSVKKPKSQFREQGPAPVEKVRVDGTRKVMLKDNDRNKKKKNNGDHEMGKEAKKGAEKQDSKQSDSVKSTDKAAMSTTRDSDDDAVGDDFFMSAPSKPKVSTKQTTPTNTTATGKTTISSKSASSASSASSKKQQLKPSATSTPYTSTSESSSTATATTATQLLTTPTSTTLLTKKQLEEDLKARSGVVAVIDAKKSKDKSAPGSASAFAKKKGVSVVTGDEVASLLENSGKSGADGLGIGGRLVASGWD